MGEEGFAPDLLYHRYIPSANKDAAPWDLPDQAPRLQPPFDATALEAARAVRRGVEDQERGDGTTSRPGQRGRPDLVGCRGRALAAVPQRDR
jgi:hypothetical protein